MMIPLGRKKAVAILEEHGSSTKHAGDYYDFITGSGFMLIENAGGLIPVPQGVESLDEVYMTDPKDAGCFIQGNAPEFASQGVPQGKG